MLRSVRHRPRISPCPVVGVSPATFSTIPHGRCLTDHFLHTDENLLPGLTKKVFDGAENRVNDILSPLPTREGVPFLVSPFSHYNEPSNHF